MLHPSDAETMEVFRRKIELLEKQANLALAGNSFAALIVVVLCWSSANSAVLILWIGAIFFVLFSRWRKIRDIKQRQDSSALDGCYKYCGISATVNGIVWGLLFTYLAFSMGPLQLPYPFATLCAITTGTCLLHNGHFNPLRNFAIPALIPPSTVLLFSGEPMKMWIGIIVVGWFLLMYSLSSQLQRYLMATVRYETENIALIRDLEFQIEKNERLNEELQLKAEIINRLASTELATVVDREQPLAKEEKKEA